MENLSSLIQKILSLPAFTCAISIVIPVEFVLRASILITFPQVTLNGSKSSRKISVEDSGVNVLSCAS